MCIQFTCPHCSAPFTSPESLLRCSTYLSNTPHQSTTISLTCPANNWTTSPHPNGFHPSADRVCPYNTGPYYISHRNNRIEEGYTSGVVNPYIPAPAPPPTITITNSSGGVRPLAPAPRVRRLPHENSELYARPGDLFKAGVWQKVAEGLKRSWAEQDRREREGEQREQRYLAREWERRRGVSGRDYGGEGMWEGTEGRPLEMKEEEEEEEEEGLEQDQQEEGVQQEEEEGQE